METTQFETRLKELSMLAGSDQTDELFNQEYAALMHDVEKAPERFEMLSRMKKLLMHQAAFLMSYLLKGKRMH